MADEFTISFNLQLTNGAQSDLVQYSGNVDQAAIGRGGYIQSVGTSEEVLNFGDVTTEGLLYLRNLDATNFVEVGPDSGGSAGTIVPLLKLLAGEIGFFRVKAGVTVKAKADTAAVLLDVRCYEA